ncbi:ERCC4 domain-containing protein, partial [Verrucomicrobiota bacterium]
VLERRTGGGFLKGIMEKTLFTSAIYMREHFRIPVLIVEGKVNYEYSMMDPQAVRGALSSMLLLYGINVLSTANMEETVQLILMMTRQEQVGIPEISLIPKRKAASLDDMQRRLVEMLPGCGMVMARDLLQSFGSIKRIVAADKDKLCTMRGIGARKAAQMYDVLNAEYESVDTEKNLEDAIEAEPKLLFKRPPSLLARQHYIYADADDRHIVDLVYINRKKKELILVELKRGQPSREGYAQICRYIDNAHKSELLRSYIDKGMKLRGILATLDKGDIKIDRDDVTTRAIDRNKAARILVKLRHTT